MFAIIEDDAFSRDILTKVVSSIGKTDVKDYATVETFLRDVKINNYKFQGIFLDLNLPGISGLDAIPLIKSMEAYKDTPIVICSSRSDKETIVKALKAGAQNYLTKPLNKDNIVQTIFALSA